MAEPAPVSDDARLLERVRAGDEAAFSVVFRSYRRPLVKFAYRYLKSVARAEEIVQQVFSEFWKLRQTVSVQIGLKSYLFGAVKNRSHTARRRGARERTWDEVARDARNLGSAGRTSQSVAQQYEAKAPAAWNDGEAAVLYSELLTILTAAVNALPEPQRNVIRLARDQEMTYNEIASVLGMTPNRVRQHIVAANVVLDEHLTRAGWPGLIRRKAAQSRRPTEPAPETRRQRTTTTDEQKEEESHEG